MSRFLEISHSSRGACRVGTKALVVGFFNDDRPLRGAVGMVDWRLNGYVSRLLEAQRLSGDSTESTLVASSGRLGADFALLVGLGQRAHYGYERITDITSSATMTLQKLHVEEFALEVPGARLMGLDPAESVYNAVKGIVKILSASAPETARMRAVFLEPDDVSARLRFGLRKAQSNFQGRVQIALAGTA
ncbi:MAG: M17 family peptidase N-terminal domain-containing protein [Deltaproteobacteria bacterium]|nr:M17 family peptidase N-terminal domain-containing protein [Deltaproteobacteria bacterium]